WAQDENYIDPESQNLFWRKFSEDVISIVPQQQNTKTVNVFIPFGQLVDGQVTQLGEHKDLGHIRYLLAIGSQNKDDNIAYTLQCVGGQCFGNQTPKADVKVNNEQREASIAVEQTTKNITFSVKVNDILENQGLFGIALSNIISEGMQQNLNLSDQIVPATTDIAFVLLEDEVPPFTINISPNPVCYGTQQHANITFEGTQNLSYWINDMYNQTLTTSSPYIVDLTGYAVGQHNITVQINNTNITQPFTVNNCIPPTSDNQCYFNDTNHYFSMCSINASSYTNQRSYFAPPARDVTPLSNDICVPQATGNATNAFIFGWIQEEDLTQVPQGVNCYDGFDNSCSMYNYFALTDSGLDTSIFKHQGQNFNVTTDKNGIRDFNLDRFHQSCFPTIDFNITNPQGQPIDATIEIYFEPHTTQPYNITTSNQEIRIPATWYTMVVKSDEYLSQAVNVNFSVLQETTVHVQLQSSECQADCTRVGSNTCDASCEGINGCTFYNNQTKEAVDGRLLGTLVNLGNNQQVRACSGEPFAVQPQRAVIECGDRPIAQVTRIVYHEGKPVRLVVATCE
ncbi:MAG: hypothetical protein ACMXYC_04825, partial [Candidatus Woesearchaeota archaeon]